MQHTILVVDDDVQILKVTVAIFKRFGYQVITAGSGQEAIDILTHRGAPVDLLFTDVFMPGMNGVQLGAALAAIQPGLKIVYTSGASREEVDAFFADPSDIRLIKKPAEIPHLIACIKEAIEGK